MVIISHAFFNANAIFGEEKIFSAFPRMCTLISSRGRKTPLWANFHNPAITIPYLSLSFAVIIL